MTEDQLAGLVQEAVDAAATAYTGDAGVDVEQRVRQELADRGVEVADDDWLSELAHHLRSGHHVQVSGEPAEDA